MFGKNQVKAPENHSGAFLDVFNIFPTLQGEGPFAGRAAVFIRLSGCNLKCSFCDTEFEEYNNFSVEEILNQVKKVSPINNNKMLVVITGGEPLRQPIELLCQELINSNYNVQIETNGTIFRQLPKEVSVICSPKVSNGKYSPIRADIKKCITAYKFIISSTSKDYCHVPSYVKTDNIPVYLQPMDEYNEDKNKQNTSLAVTLCQENNFILSLQTHKILGLD